MDESEEMAPAVRSILATARERSGSDRTLSVEARSLPDALERAEADGRVPVIAEVKPTSPTTAGERSDDPVELARQMVRGGATALSVLTEPEHFGGSPERLRRVREAVDVPVLRKDFLLHEEQLDVVEADLVLLIARFLDEDDTGDLGELIDAARERGFQVLVEVHTREELERAVAAGADILGVNNRDLAKLEVDLSTFPEVAPAAPDNVTLIAESGISSPEDAARMRDAGADALLVGSAIMDVSGSGGASGESDSGDVEANTRWLTSATTDDTETQP